MLYRVHQEHLFSLLLLLSIYFSQIYITVLLITLHNLSKPVPLTYHQNVTLLPISTQTLLCIPPASCSNSLFLISILILYTIFQNFLPSSISPIIFLTFNSVPLSCKLHLSISHPSLALEDNVSCNILVPAVQHPCPVRNWVMEYGMVRWPQTSHRDSQQFEP